MTLGHTAEIMCPTLTSSNHPLATLSCHRGIVPGCRGVMVPREEPLTRHGVSGDSGAAPSGISDERPARH